MKQVNISPKIAKEALAEAVGKNLAVMTSDYPEEVEQHLEKANEHILKAFGVIDMEEKRRNE